MKRFVTTDKFVQSKHRKIANVRNVIKFAYYKSANDEVKQIKYRDNTEPQCTLRSADADHRRMLRKMECLQV